MSLKILILKGLPGSGKTTWAKDFIYASPFDERGKVTKGPGWKRVNKDDLRNMIDAGQWSGPNEKEILRVRDMLILEFLDQGHSVIVDDTNLHPKHIAQI